LVLPLTKLAVRLTVAANPFTNILMANDNETSKEPEKPIKLPDPNTETLKRGDPIGDLKKREK
jgi:hypothetical protein